MTRLLSQAVRYLTSTNAGCGPPLLKPPKRRRSPFSAIIPLLISWLSYILFCSRNLFLPVSQSPGNKK
jgi:hypothetical protein